jgi:hypothetical protein
MMITIKGLIILKMILDSEKLNKGPRGFPTCTVQAKTESQARDSKNDLHSDSASCINTGLNIKLNAHNSY